MRIVGCVGNGDGVTVTGINVDGGTGVAETVVGIGASVDGATGCCPQAASVTSRITINKGFIELRSGFMEKDKFCKN